MKKKAFSDWTIERNEFLPEKIEHEQTIFTIGNGYLSTRGSLEEGYPGEYATTFVHGVFDEAPTHFIELVNIPDWSALSIILDGERFDLSKGKILSYNRKLDLQTGLLERRISWKSPAGKITDLVFKRFASLDNHHLLLVSVKIKPIDYSGKITVRAGLDGQITNEIPNYLVGYRHWDWVGQGTSDSSGWLHLRTKNSKIDLAMAFNLTVGGKADIQKTSWNLDNHPTLLCSCHLACGESVSYEKRCVIYTSRDVSQPAQEARKHLKNLASVSWKKLFNENRSTWQHEWDLCDVVIDSDDDAQLTMRFNLFHLLIAAPRKDDRVSIGAKTLSGYGYFGHVFWETEIYLLPFFTYTRPEIARNLLSYRWRCLSAARQKAQSNNFSGAQYSWESAVTGREVTPTWVIDGKNQKELIRIWTGDIQIHISADIAYAIWQYWKITGDNKFMIDRGGQIILETAQFWASRLEWSDSDDRYEITDVIGPDEYHEHVNNNAYTNYFVRWHLRIAVKLFEWLKESAPEQFNKLSTNLGLSPEIVQGWSQMVQQIFIPKNETTGMIEQFEGFFALKDLDLNSYEPRNRSMQEILGIKEANKVQILKQPDVIMLLYLFNKQFLDEVVKSNYEYYSIRTDHTFGSSLGPAIHALVACRLNRLQEAYMQFERTAYMDLNDTRGNSRDGIHAASAGGAWQIVVFGFAGLSVNDEGWKISPKLPDNWRRLSFKFFHKGKLQKIDISKKDS
ncbi:MAG: glycoside hydrolase family 65 protein [Anaerolineaceae bacterium]|nr:glycoside hydrolase family 65 protein [Anaerolineaceae bacterium]